MWRPRRHPPPQAGGAPSSIHAEEWTVTIRDGVPHFTPPAWIDPDRTPLRNTYHQRARDTRHAAQELSLNLPLQHRPDRT